MSDALPITPTARRYFEYLPVGLFGSVMGLTGLSIAWHLAEVRYGWPEWPSNALGIVAVVDFVTLVVAYGAKVLSAGDIARTELRHPIAGSLFGTIFISLLLLPIVISPVNLAAARVIWGIGAIGMIVFAWYMISRWLSDRQQAAHATPTWIIPVVGVLDVPLALPALDLPAFHGLAIFSLAIGLFFAIPLFTLIFSRLLFEPPMPDALKPALMILLAPFAVGYSTYQVAAGQNDLFAAALYSLTLFVLAVLVGQMRYLAKCCPFRVSWWAVSFPLAASAIASLRFAAANPSLFTNTVAGVLLVLATATILGLLGRTLFGILRGELRTLSA